MTKVGVIRPESGPDDDQDNQIDDQHAETHPRPAAIDRVALAKALCEANAEEGRGVDEPGEDTHTEPHRDLPDADRRRIESEAGRVELTDRCGVEGVVEGTERRNRHQDEEEGRSDEECGSMGFCEHGGVYSDKSIHVFPAC
ncbi:hypothetical protein [Leifsonia xyli]|nr:hypothetical protein [Leifsonia xyli]